MLRKKASTPISYAAPPTPEASPTGPCSLPANNDSPYSRLMLGGLFRRESSCSSVSSLGADLSERERLDILHTLHMTLLNPYHTDVIAQHLAQIHLSGRRSRVLEVGAGTGTWAASLANKQPFSDITAIDTDWSSFLNIRLSHGNVDFATVDASRPLPFPPAHFDVIHVKSLGLDIPHYASMVERLTVTLRPGGLLVLIEAEPRYLSSVGGSSRPVRTWDTCVREANAAHGIDVTIAQNLLGSLANSGVFVAPAYTQEVGMPCAGYMRGGEHISLLDIPIQLLFLTCPSANPSFSLQPFDAVVSDSRTLARAGRIHNRVVGANLRAMLPRLIDHGYAAEDVERLMVECSAELCSPQSGYYQRLFAVYARKSS